MFQLCLQHSPGLYNSGSLEIHTPYNYLWFFTTINQISALGSMYFQREVKEFYSDYGRCCHAAEILWWKVSAKWIWAKVLTIVWGYCYIKYCWKGWRVRRNQGLPPHWTRPVVEKGVLKANTSTFLAGEEQVREQLGGCHQTISADRGWDLFYSISVPFSHLWMLLKCLHQCFSFEKQINCCLYFSKPSELIQNLTSFIFL